MTMQTTEGSKLRGLGKWVGVTTRSQRRVWELEV